jgi:hypothetical protein
LAGEFQLSRGDFRRLESDLAGEFQLSWPEESLLFFSETAGEFQPSFRYSLDGEFQLSFLPPSAAALQSVFRKLFSESEKPVQMGVANTMYCL